MAYYPFSPQLDAVYTLESAFGTAVLNDPTSPNYVGMVTELTGLDSPEVRESAEDKVQADGGVHGSFYAGRRPITMTVRVFNATSMADREARIDRLRRATKVLRAGHGANTAGVGGTSHGELRWTNLPVASNLAMVVPFRRQQPVRVAGPWVKDVQIALVSPEHHIVGQAARSGSGTLENQGDEEAYPTLVVTSPSATFAVTNTSTGKLVRLAGLDSSNTVTIDVRNHTATQAGVGDVTGKIDFTASTWPTMRSTLLGTNTWTVSEGSGGLTVHWRDTWA